VSAWRRWWVEGAGRSLVCIVSRAARGRNEWQTSTIGRLLPVPEEPTMMSADDQGIPDSGIGL
jgi:hypothetical protein